MRDRPWLIGIVGGSGSGKTSIAQELMRRIQGMGTQGLLLDMDAYYAPLEIVKARFDGRSGSHRSVWDRPTPKK